MAYHRPFSIKSEICSYLIDIIHIFKNLTPLKGYYLLAKLAALALIEFTTESLLYEMMQAITQWLQLHLVDDFVDKCKLKEQLSLLTAHTTLLHIEQGGIVELTNSTTVRTLHIIGINLQHRLGEHTGCLRCTEVLVGFLRNSLLGTMTNQHSTGKSTTCLTISTYL